MKKGITIGLISLAGLLLLSLAYYKYWFLRKPDRRLPADERLWVSPANGRVVAVSAWDSTRLVLQKDLGVITVLTSGLGPRGHLIAIEMDVTNVHYQRLPTDSRFLSNRYRPGAFHNALIHDNEYGFRLENEHNAMLFETPDGIRYQVVQIAGLLARRIVDYVDPGQELKRGAVIGLIKLGSQVVLVLPETVEVLVKPGQLLIDGETVVGKKKAL